MYHTHPPLIAGVDYHPCTDQELTALFGLELFPDPRQWRSDYAEAD